MRKPEIIPPPRIPAGSFDVNETSVYYLVNKLMKEFGFNLEDLRNTYMESELDWSHCYCESDTPSTKLTVRWSNIY